MSRNCRWLYTEVSEQPTPHAGKHTTIHFTILLVILWYSIVYHIIVYSKISNYV